MICLELEEKVQTVADHTVEVLILARTDILAGKGNSSLRKSVHGGVHKALQIGGGRVALATGVERLRLICGFYLLCGIMDVLASSLRGLGYSVLPMVVSLVGVCALRLVWIATIFQLNRTPFMLYISYPISWALTALVHLGCLLVVRRHLRQKQQLTQAA